jgi:hypothetical protein
MTHEPEGGGLHGPSRLRQGKGHQVHALVIGGASGGLDGHSLYNSHPQKPRCEAEQARPGLWISQDR